MRQLMIVRHCVFLASLIPGNFAFAGGLEQSIIEKYILECWPDPNYNLQLNFAPVERLSEDERKPGSWSYKHKTNDRQYPQHTVSLSANEAVRVDMVIQLNRLDSSAINEGYLWNVIVAPKVKNWHFGGHWPISQSITEYARLAHKRSSLISMATLSGLEGDPVHSLVSPKDIDSAGSLNRAWETVFGKKIVSSLIYPASRGDAEPEDDYSVTFYYVPTPSPGLIHDDGYRWPSFKHVDRPGKVFGFVLSESGECLASTSVNVVRQ